MTLLAECASPAAGLADAVAATLQSVTKLRGAVELVAPGSLPNDGKVIADERPVGLTQACPHGRGTQERSRASPIETLPPTICLINPLGQLPSSTRDSHAVRELRRRWLARFSGSERAGCGAGAGEAATGAAAGAAGGACGLRIETSQPLGQSEIVSAIPGLIKTPQALSGICDRSAIPCLRDGIRSRHHRNRRKQQAGIQHQLFHDGLPGNEGKLRLQIPTADNARLHREADIFASIESARYAAIMALIFGQSFCPSRPRSS